MITDLNCVTKSPLNSFKFRSIVLEMFNFSLPYKNYFHGADSEPIRIYLKFLSVLFHIILPFKQTL
jgi:hypothetical protein